MFDAGSVLDPRKLYQDQLAHYDCVEVEYDEVDNGNIYLSLLGAGRSPLSLRVGFVAKGGFCNYTSWSRADFTLPSTIRGKDVVTNYSVDTEDSGGAFIAAVGLQFPTNGRFSGEMSTTRIFNEETGATFLTVSLKYSF